MLLPVVVMVLEAMLIVVILLRMYRLPLHLKFIGIFNVFIVVILNNVVSSSTVGISFTLMFSSRM